MTGFLLHLQGPMQSWADTGFGQIREAGLFPSRAGVLGIVAAALGIPRGDERLVALHDAFHVHIAVVRSGTVLKDYHTVETKPGKSKTLTWRDYRHDAHFAALVEAESSSEVDHAVAALRDPVYATFLGRRSCPPATPLLPVLLPQDRSPIQALLESVLAAKKHLPVTGETRWGFRESRPETVLYLDAHLLPAELPAPLTGLHATYGNRRDRLVSRWRAYVNRPYTRVIYKYPQAETDPQDEYFSSAS